MKRALEQKKEELALKAQKYRTDEETIEELKFALRTLAAGRGDVTNKIISMRAVQKAINIIKEKHDNELQYSARVAMLRMARIR